VRVVGTKERLHGWGYPSRPKRRDRPRRWVEDREGSREEGRGDDVRDGHRGRDGEDLQDLQDRGQVDQRGRPEPGGRTGSL
jgi:hypothetical protein